MTVVKPVASRRQPASEASHQAKHSQTKASQPKPAVKAKPVARAKTDDLKLIAGIGPKLEQVLNAKGIRSFAEIAAWTDEEIAGSTLSSASTAASAVTTGPARRKFWRGGAAERNELSGRVDRPERWAGRRTGGGLKMPVRVPGLECATENLGDIRCRQDERSGLAMRVLQK